MKKIYALFPSEREKECYHEAGFYWTGSIPCTGKRVCHMCGMEEQEALNEKRGD